ncbi:unnamed protein product, partial [Amoebophrya sp. A25]
YQESCSVSNIQRKIMAYVSRSCGSSKIVTRERGWLHCICLVQLLVLLLETTTVSWSLNLNRRRGRTETAATSSVGDYGGVTSRDSEGGSASSSSDSSEQPRGRSTRAGTRVGKILAERLAELNLGGEEGAESGSDSTKIFGRSTSTSRATPTHSRALSEPLLSAHRTANGGNVIGSIPQVEQCNSNWHRRSRLRQTSKECCHHQSSRTTNPRKRLTKAFSTLKASIRRKLQQLPNLEEKTQTLLLLGLLQGLICLPDNTVNMLLVPKIAESLSTKDSVLSADDFLVGWKSSVGGALSVILSHAYGQLVEKKASSVPAGEQEDDVVVPVHLETNMTEDFSPRRRNVDLTPEDADTQTQKTSQVCKKSNNYNGNIQSQLKLLQKVATGSAFSSAVVVLLGMNTAIEELLSSSSRSASEEKQKLDQEEVIAFYWLNNWLCGGIQGFMVPMIGTIIKELYGGGGGGEQGHDEEASHALKDDEQQDHLMEPDRVGPDHAPRNKTTSTAQEAAASKTTAQQAALAKLPLFTSAIPGLAQYLAACGSYERWISNIAITNACIISAALALSSRSATTTDEEDGVRCGGSVKGSCDCENPEDQLRAAREHFCSRGRQVSKKDQHEDNLMPYNCDDTRPETPSTMYYPSPPPDSTVARSFLQSKNMGEEEADPVEEEQEADHDDDEEEEEGDHDEEEEEADHEDETETGEASAFSRSAARSRAENEYHEQEEAKSCSPAEEVEAKSSSGALDLECGKLSQRSESSSRE